jgi:hypothetical protein
VRGVPGFSLFDAPVSDHGEHPISFTRVEEIGMDD